MRTPGQGCCHISPLIMTMTSGGEQIALSLRPDFPKVRQGWEAGACGEGPSELAMRPRPPSFSGSDSQPACLSLPHSARGSLPSCWIRKRTVSMWVNWARGLSHLALRIKAGAKIRVKVAGGPAGLCFLLPHLQLSYSEKTWLLRHRAGPRAQLWVTGGIYSEMLSI